MIEQNLLKEEKLNGNTEKEGEIVRIIKTEDKITYFVVGAIIGKFLEFLLNIKNLSWWLSFLIGGILGIIILYRKRIF